MATKTPEERIVELGLDTELPPSVKSVAVYKPVVIIGNLAYTSGQIPRDAKGQLSKGKVGQEVTVESGYQSARLCGLAMLSVLRAELGSLNRVKRVVKITGFVNSTPDFEQQPQVINGCSELFRDIFGEAAGVGSRSAVGVSSLPLGVPTEVEGIFELTDQ